jgi:transposase
MTLNINDSSGLLTACGEVMPPRRDQRHIPGALGRLSDRLPAMAIETFREQYACLGELDEQISRIEGRPRRWQREDSATQRVAAIPGVGLLSATAAVATMGNAKALSPAERFRPGPGCRGKPALADERDCSASASAAKRS